LSSVTTSQNGIVKSFFSMSFFGRKRGKG